MFALYLQTASLFPYFASPILPHLCRFRIAGVIAAAESLSAVTLGEKLYVLLKLKGSHSRLMTSTGKFYQ